MKDYIATFHTHFSAQQSCRDLKAAGVTARMAPVPRQLSSSCGTCVRYQGNDPCMFAIHQDFEEIYLIIDGKYKNVLMGLTQQEIRT